jgi:tetrahydromethanopterin S-methyltransferase subunit G
LKAQRLDDGIARIEQRFDSVERRLDRIDQNFDRMWSEFAATRRHLKQIGWGIVAALFVQIVAAVVAAVIASS